MKLNYKLENLERIASEILEQAKSKYILFSGEMGSGKTTLIKELVKKLGSHHQVSSPTFSLVNEYEGENSVIYHFDFYRIEDETEAYDMGFEDYLDDSHYVFIEWPEKISNLWPEHYSHIKLEVNENQSRSLTLNEF
ncbi:tRNA (adenosine(37)-N6)-threonylcarbamoyltransferase complex ATPase subunit type 1 TsaE [Psychroflexus sp. CAK57W]|uniref:tRNA (adenosine(37)-N6)-threonylcarbamoyltransferase complex ATPase subunit type 1 TsaE n=1 Tax=Psychroflexus curvus TaxID=2873595 RepID=UPI001CCF0F68|nr:tRNA (adenosine(37)-N6)-threonylcarbamoyltransferase complex ATPase subunit type 1 TsaE [Psychroflexus curvus]MBZ9786550.1 tRNA (adenosine(37)-N6)-threonylcarbamoyltransferase complex ATPase subunit type 1 TsaE [Psychroflexus curvus]